MKFRKFRIFLLNEMFDRPWGCSTLSPSLYFINFLFPENRNTLFAQQLWFVWYRSAKIHVADLAEENGEFALLDKIEPLLKEVSVGGSLSVSLSTFNLLHV